MEAIIKASKQISMFCRFNMNTKHDLPIRSSEMGMLIYLVKTKEEKTPNGVATFFKVTKAMATNMVTSLLTKGYIEKKQSEVDKRSFILVPTNKAIRLVDKTYTDYFKTMTTLEKKMGKEKFDQMITLIETANQILWEEKNNG